MILPHTDTILIVLMVISMLCLGTWPIFFKLAKKYRFELFYFDFGLGLSLVALIAAFSFGSLGYDGFNFADDLLNARKQQWLVAMLAAMIFNFGHMFMIAGISVAGMAVAVPMAFGATLIVGGWIGYLGQPGMNGMLMMVGTVLVLVSLILNSSGYSQLRRLQHETMARAGKTKSTRRPNSIKGILLPLVGGIVMGTFGPLLLRSQDPDDGVGPYSLLFLFAFAVVISTFIFNLFFMNLPVEGDPLEIADYFRTTVKNHALGFIGGVVWGIGALAAFVAATPKGDTHLSAPLGSMIGQAGPIVAALWGLLYWKELKAGDGRVKAFAALTLVLFAGGLAFFSLATAAAPPTP